MVVKKKATGGDEKPPDFIKGRVVHYPYGEYPKVQVGVVYGYATAHSSGAVIVEWEDGDRVHS